jgi:hypothetical protein
MRVDMSPGAVHERLVEMEQLWELSVALLDSRPLDGSHFRPRRRETVLIQESIRKVLVEEWDPIGVGGVPEAIDEYDSYIGRLYSILVGSRSADEIAACLANIESEEMGVATSDEVRCHVAQRLLRLPVALS